jgi:hypothetical protein
VRVRNFYTYNDSTMEMNNVMVPAPHAAPAPFRPLILALDASLLACGDTHIPPHVARRAAALAGVLEAVEALCAPTAGGDGPPPAPPAVTLVRRGPLAAEAALLASEGLRAALMEAGAATAAAEAAAATAASAAAAAPPAAGKGSAKPPPASAAKGKGAPPEPEAPPPPPPPPPPPAFDVAAAARAVAPAHFAAALRARVADDYGAYLTAAAAAALAPPPPPPPPPPEAAPPAPEPPVSPPPKGGKPAPAATPAKGATPGKGAATPAKGASAPPSAPPSPPRAPAPAGPVAAALALLGAAAPALRALTAAAAAPAPPTHLYLLLDTPRTPLEVAALGAGAGAYFNSGGGEGGAACVRPRFRDGEEGALAALAAAGWDAPSLTAPVPAFLAGVLELLAPAPLSALPAPPPAPPPAEAPPPAPPPAVAGKGGKGAPPTPAPPAKAALGKGGAAAAAAPVAAPPPPTPPPPPPPPLPRGVPHSPLFAALAEALHGTLGGVLPPPALPPLPHDGPSRPPSASAHRAALAAAADPKSPPPKGAKAPPATTPAAGKAPTPAAPTPAAPATPEKRAPAGPSDAPSAPAAAVRACRRAFRAGEEAAPGARLLRAAGAAPPCNDGAAAGAHAEDAPYAHVRDVVIVGVPVAAVEGEEGGASERTPDAARVPLPLAGAGAGAGSGGGSGGDAPQRPMAPASSPVGLAALLLSAAGRVACACASLVGVVARAGGVTRVPSAGALPPAVAAAAAALYRAALDTLPTPAVGVPTVLFAMVESVAGAWVACAEGGGEGLAPWDPHMPVPCAAFPALLPLAGAVGVVEAGESSGTTSVGAVGGGGGEALLRGGLAAEDSAARAWPAISPGGAWFGAPALAAAGARSGAGVAAAVGALCPAAGADSAEAAMPALRALPLALALPLSRVLARYATRAGEALEWYRCTVATARALPGDDASVVRGVTAAGVAGLAGGLLPGGGGGEREYGARSGGGGGGDRDCHPFFLPQGGAAAQRSPRATLRFSDDEGAEGGGARGGGGSAVNALGVVDCGLWAAVACGGVAAAAAPPRELRRTPLLLADRLILSSLRPNVPLCDMVVGGGGGGGGEGTDIAAAPPAMRPSLAKCLGLRAVFSAALCEVLKGNGASGGGGAYDAAARVLWRRSVEAALQAADTLGNARYVAAYEGGRRLLRPEAGEQFEWRGDGWAWEESLGAEEGAVVVAAAGGAPPGAAGAAEAEGLAAHPMARAWGETAFSIALADAAAAFGALPVGSPASGAPGAPPTACLLLAQDPTSATVTFAFHVFTPRRRVALCPRPRAGAGAAAPGGFRRPLQELLDAPPPPAARARGPLIDPLCLLSGDRSEVEGGGADGAAAAVTTTFFPSDRSLVVVGGEAPGDSAALLRAHMAEDRGGALVTLAVAPGRGSGGGGPRAAAPLVLRVATPSAWREGALRSATGGACATAAAFVDTAAARRGGGASVPLRGCRVDVGFPLAGLRVSLCSDGEILQEYAGCSAPAPAPAPPPPPPRAAAAAREAAAGAALPEHLLKRGETIALPPPAPTPDPLPAAAFPPWPAWLPEARRVISGRAGTVLRTLSVTPAVATLLGLDAPRAARTLEQELRADGGMAWVVRDAALARAIVSRGLLLGKSDGDGGDALPSPAWLPTVEGIHLDTAPNGARMLTLSRSGGAPPLALPLPPVTVHTALDAATGATCTVSVLRAQARARSPTSSPPPPPP